jgi:hypothetical protein
VIRRATRDKRRRWPLALAAVLLIVATLGIPPVRVAGLQALGRTLAIADPVSAADVIVISVDAGDAGVLEAADLVRERQSTRVAVCSEPTSAAEVELTRRGVHPDDSASRAIRQLSALGVTETMRIPTPVSGTNELAEVLPRWLDEHKFRSAVLVTTTDHSRRTRRAITRGVNGSPLRIAVRPSRYSGFDPEQWWRSRGSLRTGIIEIQKLFLDVLRHPLS